MRPLARLVRASAGLALACLGSRVGALQPLPHRLLLLAMIGGDITTEFLREVPDEVILTRGAAATEHDQQALRPLHDAMQTIVTEFSASPTDDAPDLVNAAQVVLTGEWQDVRNLRKPWGVHLTA